MFLPAPSLYPVRYTPVHVGKSVSISVLVCYQSMILPLNLNYLTIQFFLTLVSPVSTTDLPVPTDSLASMRLNSNWPHLFYTFTTTLPRPPPPSNTASSILPDLHSSSLLFHLSIFSFSSFMFPLPFLHLPAFIPSP